MTLLVLEMLLVLLLLLLMQVPQIPFQCMEMGSCSSLSTAWHHSVVRSSQSS
jgi:hypothetical protein